MGIKRKIKNYIHIKKHYPLSEKIIAHDVEKKTILIVESQIPTFDKDSASNRITEIAKFLAKHYNVYLMDWRKAIPDVDSKKYIRNLNDHNVIVYTPFINKFGILKGKKHFINDLLPKIDHVWCHRPELFEYYLDFFRSKAPKAKIIYDMVDIHYLRMERGLEIKYDKKRAKEVEYYKHIETELSKKADKIAVISDKEKEFMRAFVNESKLFTVSNVHNLKVKPEDMPGFEKRSGIFFIGTFLHDPNVDAVEILHQKIMPLVWKTLPDLKISIIGSEAPESILKMNSERFEVVGYVEDIIPYYKKCFASVSPLRFGAGVKGKIGQALEYTLPVLTTEIGAEGMFLQNGSTALIAGNDDYQTFADNIIKICTDKNTWEKLHNNSEKAIFPFSIEAQKEEIFQMLK
ncbi:glycosyltransferase [Epilithonimonas ginsengisoli]|uniref:Glycosyltransferase n=1 Tax=Epilithonimonas ginsengisoli TaxID=1245592 RepID=A0ABU4JCF8_9FLAO|nr:MULTISPECIES: glycosyltransferase [Chryseobacterium group]MBV6878434.1 glycosyltransferase family 4 protein [Epilithonimonas sp. FP105]MDW8547323.1 glycosyltransferase [Epilithonimonas ginsengisoli]OAH69078.1 glycosyl transferase family 2 [Chryseobacterium sp. FP211-J200]